MCMQGQTNCLLDEPPDPGEQQRPLWQGGYRQCQTNFSGICRRAETECCSKEWPSARAFTHYHSSLAVPPLSSYELVWLTRLLTPWDCRRCMVQLRVDLSPIENRNPWTLAAPILAATAVPCCWRASRKTYRSLAQSHTVACITC